MTHEPLVVVDDVHHSYAGPGGEVPVLRGVDLTAARGRLVVVRGRSGSGKTTLLNIIGGLSAPDRGRVVIDGQEVTAMDEAARLRLRRDRVGFIFQTFGLLPLLTAAENVGVPLRLQGADRTEREVRVRLLLAMVGLGDHAAQRPDELSGGQQQRVAIARALAGRPAVLIADEPTGQLDSETGRSVLELLRAVVAEGELTAIVATHDPVLVSVADDVFELRDGCLHPAS